MVVAVAARLLLFLWACSLLAFRFCKRSLQFLEGAQRFLCYFIFYFLLWARNETHLFVQTKIIIIFLQRLKVSASSQYNRNVSMSRCVSIRFLIIERQRVVDCKK